MSYSRRSQEKNVFLMLMSTKPKVRFGMIDIETANSVQRLNEIGNDLPRVKRVNKVVNQLRS